MENNGRALECAALHNPSGLRRSRLPNAVFHVGKYAAAPPLGGFDVVATWFAVVATFTQGC